METYEKVHKSKVMDKIKITDDGESVLISWKEIVLTEKYDKESDQLVAEDKNFLTHQTSGDFIPHKDFMDAMKMLRKPVIDICELGDYKKFDSYRIYGVSFSGEQDDAKVIISAGKQVEWSGNVFNFNTPSTPLFDNDKYTGSKQLDKFCAAIIKEAWAYLEGKHTENPQLSLQFEDDSNVKMAVQK